MAQETNKARLRREAEGWYTKYLIGKGIDIGCGKCPITESCLPWDVENGDAQTLPGVAKETFDWIYSSHCLEHMRDPRAALARWWEVLKPGGFMLISVPDEDLYEQGYWPSPFNPDHKSTWTISKDNSWSKVSYNLKNELESLPGSKLLSIELIDTDYNYNLKRYMEALFYVPRHTVDESIKAQQFIPPKEGMLFIEFRPIDQTYRFAAEASIEAVVQKAYA